jgi:PST family polysaccharide transporter
VTENSRENKSSHKQILRSSLIIGGASVINILVGLLRMKVVAVLLGPAGVGLIGILNNLMATGANIAALGVANSGTRQVAEAVGRDDPDAIDASRRALFLGTLVLAVLGSSLFWCVRDLIAIHILDDKDLAQFVGWVSIGIGLTVATGSQRALLTGMRRVGDIARMTVVSSLVGALVGIAAIYYLGETGIIILVLSAPLVGLVSSHFYVAKLPKTQSERSPFREIKQQWSALLKLGFAFMVAGLAMPIGQLVVRAMVQNQLGLQSLGYFQASWAISMTYIGFVLGAMATDYYPRLTAAISDHKKVARLVNEQAEVAILLAGPVLLAMMALAPWVIKLLYSEQFTASINVLRWQILGDTLKIISWPIGFVILASGRGRLFVMTEMFATSVFVVASWAFMPLLGIDATGVAFFLMYLSHFPPLLVITHMLVGFSFSNNVKQDALQLVLVVTGVAILSVYSDFYAAIVGSGASVVLGYYSVLRLSRIADIGGPIGKVLKKISIAH